GHVATGPHDDGGHVLGIVPHSSKCRVRFTKPEHEVGPVLLELDVFAVANHTEVALKVVEGILQCRRVQHHKAEKPTAARFIGSTETQPQRGTVQHCCSAFYQPEDRRI